MKPTTLAFLSGLACAFACGVAMKIPDAGAQAMPCQNWKVKVFPVSTTTETFVEVGWEPFGQAAVASPSLWVRKCN